MFSNAHIHSTDSMNPTTVKPPFLPTQEKAQERHYVTIATERYLANPFNAIKVIPFGKCSNLPVPTLTLDELE